jgi:peptidoglycan hydrolase CwlO-like protein
MSKICRGLFAILFLMCVLLPLNVNAQTIADLKRQLAAEEAKQKANSASINQTESQIAQTKAAINQTYADIDSITKEIPRLEEEIVQLGKDIEAKDAETKELMKALEVTSGDSF